MNGHLVLIAQLVAVVVVYPDLRRLGARVVAEVQRRVTAVELPVGDSSCSWRPSWSEAELTSSLNWLRTCRVVSTPTIAPKPKRITNVSAADPPASRQRMGNALYAEDVACAADRMEEAILPTGFQLSSEVGHEHLDGVRHRERVIAPHLVEQTLAETTIRSLRIRYSSSSNSRWVSSTGRSPRVTSWVSGLRVSRRR